MFLMGGGLFLAGIVTSLPHLATILLMLGGCLLACEGAFHWGTIGQLPVIILPRGQDKTDQLRFWTGVGAFLWAWLSLCLGVFMSVLTGYGCELLGFWAIFLIERYWQNRGVIPVSFYLVKMGFTFLASAGLLFALIASHGPL
ncbi:DUF3429 domain-containing protein [Acetobacteraceae bacterium ESL0709]|nr:DUF3429 domain-containing protein [Acetobacteraceae bacterium ESL0697]MDF7677914.1 DUF3429 domain-containing protein [Acetobacteraceae bacterium ESL0709]